MGRMARPRSPKRTDDVDATVDELYAASLESFTRSRNELAKKLRGAGDRDAAERVASLQKPTIAAWAVNQLSRRHRREVDLVLDAGHRLIEAQQGARTVEELAAAAKQQRDAVEALVRHARALLGARASETTMRKVAESLRAASLTEDGRESLARGRLTDAVTTTGWEILVERAGVSTAAPRAVPSPKKPDRRAEIEQARRMLKAAEVEHAEVLREARGAAQEREKARQELERSELHANAAAEKLAGAAEAVSEAKAELDRLRRGGS